MDQAENLRNIIKSQNEVKVEKQEHLARVITVTSGKGGVGKSSVSVNLAIQLSKQGKKVIILDADFGLANVEVMLGLRPKYNLADLMFRGKKLEDIITVGPENIGFISGGSGIKELSNLTREQVLELTKMLYELDSMADVIIVDTGAGISDSVLEFVSASSEVLLVVTPEPTSITDAYALLKTLHKTSSFNSKETVIQMVANRVNNQEEGNQLYNKLSVVVNKFLSIQMEFLGGIPYDSSLPKAVMKQTPVTIAFPNSASSKAMMSIANKFEDNETKAVDKKRGIMKLFSNMIGIRR